ncbi:MAG: hypothetical protein U0X91_12155 [Spirosomataceae bacterium]
MKTLLIVWMWLYPAANAEENTAASERGSLVLYRRKDYFGADFTVKINNQLVTQKFSNNEYLQLEVPAGKVKIDTEGGFITDKKSMLFSVRANETVYLKGIVDYDYLSNALYFKRTDNEQAAQEIRKTKLDETALRKIE